MGRKAHANYIEAALAVLQELGGGQIRTKILVTAMQERGLVGDGKWMYHYVSRKLRDSDLFNTAIRGQISLSQNIEPVVREPFAAPAPAVEEEDPMLESEDEAYPGPVLGAVGFEG